MDFKSFESSISKVNYEDFIDEVTNNLKRVADNNNKINDAGIMFLTFTKALEVSDKIAIKRLEEYHSWLIKNYDCKPKS